MLLTLVEFLLRSLISIVGFIFLLRAWLYVWAFSPRHPFVMFVRRVSDWWSNPVSRIIPPQGAFDWPNLLGAFLAAILTVVLSRLCDSSCNVLCRYVDHCTLCHASSLGARDGWLVLDHLYVYELGEPAEPNALFVGYVARPVLAPYAPLAAHDRTL